MMYAQTKKSMGVNSGLRGGQLIGSPLPIQRQGNCSSRAVRTVAPKGADAPSCWKMRPSPSVVWEHRVLQHIQVPYTRGGALVEEEGSNNSV